MQDSLLDTKGWIQLKVFMNLDKEATQRMKLNIYYGILLLLKPILTNEQLIDAFFYSQYGPEDYTPEPKKLYIKRVRALPTCKVSYIRIRIHPMEGKHADVIDSVSRLLTNQILVWDFEILNEYDTRGDLGNRYGRKDDNTIDDEATINFVKYWDAGCRYILSVLNDSNDFRQNVDVWGIPHLINNAVGSSLRLPGKCQKCKGRLWLMTSPVNVEQEITLKTLPLKILPLFLTICQDCGQTIAITSNI